MLSLPWVCAVVRTSNFEISRRCLLVYVKEIHLNARSPCSTIIFPRTTNHITDLGLWALVLSFLKFPSSSFRRRVLHIFSTRKGKSYPCKFFLKLCSCFLQLLLSLSHYLSQSLLKVGCPLLACLSNVSVPVKYDRNLGYLVNEAMQQKARNLK